MNKFPEKIAELKYIFTWFPIRLKRFLLHFSMVIPGMDYKLPAKPSGIFIWSLDLFFYIVDLIGLSDILHVSHILSKGTFRKLKDDEVDNLRDIFSDSVNFDAIWVDDHSKLGLKKLAKAYVLFNTVNYSQSIDFPTLAHEIVHIWQFQNIGSMYLGRALLVHRMKDPYSFGGAQQLYNDMIVGKSLLTYNFEQQGAILEYLVGLKRRNISHPLFHPIFRFYQKELFRFNNQIRVAFEQKTQL